MTMGRSLRDLGTPALPWIDLLVIVRRLPPSSALGREVTAQEQEEPGDELWDLHAHLLATALDVLNVISWRLSRGRRSDYPEPVRRPGARPLRTGHRAMSLAEARDFADRRRRGLPA